MGRNIKLDLSFENVMKINNKFVGFRLNLSSSISHQGTLVHACMYVVINVLIKLLKIVEEEKGKENIMVISKYFQVNLSIKWKWILNYDYHDGLYSHIILISSHPLPKIAKNDQN